MRIRNFRLEDISTLAHIQHVAAEVDKRTVVSEPEFAAWISAAEIDAASNAFVITDDDDEINTWGQAGTLEGVEGEIVGYTVLQMRQDQEAYHLYCQGTVHPQHRRRNAGRALIICALNRARLLAFDFEVEAEQIGVPIYFEVLFPAHDPSSARLAAKCEMQKADVAAADGLWLYRQTL
jgi:ribosomal protein S18 acetylase RimI-like enzyme